MLHIYGGVSLCVSVLARRACALGCGEILLPNIYRMSDLPEETILVLLPS